MLKFFYKQEAGGGQGGWEEAGPRRPYRVLLGYRNTATGAGSGTFLEGN